MQLRVAYELSRRQDEPIRTGPSPVPSAGAGE